MDLIKWTERLFKVDLSEAALTSDSKPIKLSCKNPKSIHAHTHTTGAKEQLKRQNYHTRLLFQYFMLLHISSDTQTTICGLMVGVKLVCNEGRVSVWMEVSPVYTEPLGDVKRERNLWPQREVPIQLLTACLPDFPDIQPTHLPRKQPALLVCVRPEGVSNDHSDTVNFMLKALIWTIMRTMTGTLHLPCLINTDTTLLAEKCIKVCAPL